MKKILIMLLSLMLLLSVPFFALADNVYPADNLKRTPYELFSFWEENGYPDYVCGVWSTDGSCDNLTFGITDGYDEAGNKGKDIILLNVSDASKVTFVYQKYSKKYLLSIMDEMNVIMERDALSTGIYFAGIYDDKNYVKIGIKKEMQNNAETVALVESLLKKYNDAILIEYTDENIIYLNTLLPIKNNSETSLNNKVFLIFFFVLLATILMLFTALMVYKKRIKKLSLSNGDEKETSFLSRTDVKKIIKESTFSPPDSIKSDIINKIEKK